MHPTKMGDSTYSNTLGLYVSQNKKVEFLMSLGTINLLLENFSVEFF